MSDPVVLKERRGPALWLTINRPEQRNAITDEVVNGIHEGLKEAEATPQIRVVVLTGAGDRAFCAGADLKPGRGAFEGAPEGGTPFGRLLRDVRRAGTPMIARVNGHCMAGGFGLLGMCDMAVAVEGARFGLPEVKVGVFPLQVYTIVRDIIPPRKMREYALTGEPFEAAEALAVGLVNYVVAPQDLDAKVEWLVQRLADKSPAAQRIGKQAMAASEHLDFDESLALMERAIVELGASPDAIEGRRAFTEKRQPVWSEQ